MIIKRNHLLSDTQRFVHTIVGYSGEKGMNTKTNLSYQDLWKTSPVILLILKSTTMKNLLLDVLQQPCKERDQTLKYVKS